MILPEQEYFTLSELAERWGTTERRLLELILNSELWAVALVSGVALASWSDERGAHTDDSTSPRQFEIRTWFDPKLLFSIFAEGSGQLNWYVEDGKEYRFPDPLRITKGDLLVTRGELDRFEKGHSLAPDESTDPGPEEDSELKRTQRALAALVLGLADKYPVYRSGEKPNAKQLARLATEHLRDATSDRTPHGFSETTVRQAISAALKACSELTE
jgi:hypothetical protein